MELKELPQYLKKLIKGTRKTQMIISEELNIGHATLSRVLSGKQSMSKSMAKRFNDYFEVAIFYPYKIDKGNNFIPNFVIKNNRANKFNPGDTILNLLNKNTYNISEIKFNKKLQEWIYLLDNQWVEEFYIKEINLDEPKPIDTLESEIIDTFKPITPYTSEENTTASDAFEIPQIKITPKENVMQSIEKINDKDSIKDILKDVVTRLINLL